MTPERYSIPYVSFGKLKEKIEPFLTIITRTLQFCCVVRD